MTRGVAHDDETRAAVLAALLAGQSVSAVARDYHLDRRTVSDWRDAAGLTSTPVQQEKRSEWGDLVAGVLRELLITVQVQTIAYRDPTWLGKQNAADAAVLTGVLLDKAVRILEAAESSDSPADAPVATPSGTD